jgi:hypothetical protein
MAQIDDPVMALPPAYYAAIGEFAFRFAQLEYQLHEIVWMALDLSYKAGRVLTIGTDVRVLCGMVNTITSTPTWITDKTRIQEMNSLANNARKLSGLRNRLMHGSWQGPGGNPKRARLHFMKEVHERILPRYDPKLDDRYIAKKAGELGALNERAKKLIRLLDGARPSSQGKFP